MDCLSVSHVDRRFRDGGLQDITFAVARGERFALFGGAGAGKSALLQLIAGRLDPDAGDVRVLGLPTGEAAARMGFAQQSHNQRTSGTARQRILAALSDAQIPMSQRPARVVEALHAAGLFEWADRPVRELNHSAAVSLRIAVATAHRPDLILIDDLIRILPPSDRCRWWAYLDERIREGAAVVYATMDSTEAEEADRVLLLDRGIILACGTPQALLAECRGEEIVVEAADIDSVQRTLRGIPSVEVVSSPDGSRFYAADGTAVAAHLFRHPIAGMRGVFVRRPSLWDCFDYPRSAASY